jgi:two-component system sensor histidine kinase VicK
MSATDVQVRFAAEFALFLVAFAGVGFAFLRSDLLVLKPAARVASVLGFACLVTAGFLSGALIVDEPTDPVVVALRLAGIVLLAGSSLAWRTDRGGRELLRIGLVALVVAEIVLSNDQASTLADAARGIGALAVGACLVGASARVISARIAATGAMILFAVITAVAVALSSVVSSNIESEALDRYSARVDTEATAISGVAPDLLSSARLLASLLQTTENAQIADALRRATDPARALASTTRDQELLASVIDQFIAGFVKDQDPRRGPTLLIYANATPRLLVSTPPTYQGSLITELQGQRSVLDALQSGAPTQDVAVVDGPPLAVATAPVIVNKTTKGVIVRTTKLDGSYLQLRGAPIELETPGVALALVASGHTVATAGSSGAVEDSALRRLGSRAAELEDEDALRTTVGERFYVAAPVLGDDGSPVMALILSAPRAEEDAAREDLFRVLFLVSMGAAAAALILAGLAGERIGGGLRRIAEAASEIERGNLDVRTGVATDDELGTVGRSFDSMALSLSDLTKELREAVLDEAVLRARLEAVVGGMGEALIAVDGDARVTDFNAAAEELLDVPAREVLHRSVGDVVDLRSEDGTAQSRRLRRPVLEAWTMTGSVRLGGGREVPVSVSAGALRGSDGAVNGAVFVLRDQRRERELDRMKTEFLSAISHELRTPLTPIKGFASILQTRDLPAARAKGFADEISTAADQLERVIGQLVNFATLQSGRLTLEVEPVAVRPMIDGVLAGWKDRLGPGHSVRRKVAARVPRVEVDKAYVSQALDELLDNAVKYSPDGGKISVDAVVVEGEDGPELEIAVTDQGVGIPADRLGSVIGDFTQADASATRRFGGLGRGQAGVYPIVRAHDGQLDIESTVGEGTRVSIRLPVAGPAHRRYR